MAVYDRHMFLFDMKLKLLLLRLVPWLCFFIGAALLYLGNQGLSSVKRTEGWAAIGGRILSSTIVQQATLRGEVRYDARVVYEYRVGTAVLHGTRLAAADQSVPRPSDAHSIVNRYPAGTSVTVYYNPAVPSESVVERGNPAQPYWLLGVGVCFVFLGPVLSIRLSRCKARRAA